MDNGAPDDASGVFSRDRVLVVLQVARLLRDDPGKAADDVVGAVTWAASRAGRQPDDAVQTAMLGRIARAALRRARLTSMRTARGRLELVESPGLADDDAATDPAAAIRDGWLSLTLAERVAVALHAVGGLEAPRIAREARRSPAGVRRDLDRGLSFLSEVAGLPIGAGDQASASADVIGRALVARAAGSAHDDVLVASLSRRLMARGGEPRARGRFVLAGVAVVVTALVVAASWRLAADDPADDLADHSALADPADAGLPVLPPAPGGLKLVGYHGIMLTVPMAWAQVAAPCDSVTDNYVVYPVSPRSAPCDVLAPRLSGLSFGAADQVDLPSLNRSPGEVTLDRVVVTSIRREGTRFVQVAAMLDANVAVTVRSTERSQVRAVIASVQRVPAGFAVMPMVEGLGPAAAQARLERAGLTGMVYQDPSQVGYHPLVVAKQAPAVGTLLAENEVASLGVVLR